MKRVKNSLLTSLLVFFLLAPIISYSAQAFPSPTNLKYLNDYVGVVNENDKSNIISIGRELELKTGAQAVLVIIDSTKDVPIEDYANSLFRSWGIGEKNKDNGLLILLALNDKKWRVEVGRGLEGAIPDALSNRVMETLAKPEIIQGNYSKGLSDSYSALSDYIASEYGVTLDKSLKVYPPQTQNQNTSNTLPFIGGGFLLLILLDVLLNRGRISNTLLQLIFISNLTRRGPRGGGRGGPGGFGGFGGGSSGGGGSTGGWD
ncbi:MAG: TPM domain-containing protein [Clostridium sp.]